jgi:hypothetical protein
MAAMADTIIKALFVMSSRDTEKLNVNLDAVADILNKLRDDINEEFEVSEQGPRINRGPCGPFAALFYETWNSIFSDPCQICFLMAVDNPDLCYHILVKLPDGKFFDGGYGVADLAQAEEVLIKNFGEGGAVIKVMDDYDEDLFDRYSGGRIKSGQPIGAHCPKYSKERAKALIERRLQDLARIDS